MEASMFHARGITYTKVTSLNEGPAVIIATWLIAVISIIFVVSRLGIKLVVIKKMQAEDYFIIGALVCVASQNPYFFSWSVMVGLI